eukprot:gene11204-11354_t
MGWQIFKAESGLKEYVLWLNRDNKALHEPAVCSTSSEGVEVSLALQWAADTFSDNLVGFANSIKTIDGGSHMDGLRAAITRLINNLARKNKGLALRCNKQNKKVPSPEFEGQTKTRLGNPEVRRLVDAAVTDQLGAWLESHPNALRDVVGKALTAAQAAEAARKARELVRRKHVLTRSTLPGKLADCTSSNRESTEIFLVEGDSAGGSAKQARDRHTQAILPLRGKILNVERKDDATLYKNQEIASLIVSLADVLACREVCRDWKQRLGSSFCHTIRIPHSLWHEAASCPRLAETVAAAAAAYPQASGVLLDAGGSRPGLPANTCQLQSLVLVLMHPRMDLRSLTHQRARRVPLSMDCLSCLVNLTQLELSSRGPTGELLSDTIAAFSKPASLAALSNLRSLALSEAALPGTVLATSWLSPLTALDKLQFAAEGLQVLELGLGMRFSLTGGVMRSLKRGLRHLQELTLVEGAQDHLEGLGCWCNLQRLSLIEGRCSVPLRGLYELSMRAAMGRIPGTLCYSGHVRHAEELASRLGSCLHQLRLDCLTGLGSSGRSVFSSTGSGTEFDLAAAASDLAAAAAAAAATGAAGQEGDAAAAVPVVPALQQLSALTRLEFVGERLGQLDVAAAASLSGLSQLLALEIVGQEPWLLPELGVKEQLSRAFCPVVECAHPQRKQRTQKRHMRIRRKLSGTTERPRLAVFRSNNHIYAQVIDDTVGRTLAAASTLTPDLKSSLEEVGSANIAAAEAVGKKLAELCLEKQISKVCFDRGGFAYHGRVQALADAAREGGLEF